MKDEHLFKFDFGSRGIKYVQTTYDFGQTCKKQLKTLLLWKFIWLYGPYMSTDYFL